MNDIESDDELSANDMFMNFSDGDEEVDSTNETYKDKMNLKDMSLCPEYNSLGGPTEICKYCNALMWIEERVNKQQSKANPLFSICCCKGMDFVNCA